MVFKSERARRWHHANAEIFRTGSPDEISEEINRRESTKQPKKVKTLLEKVKRSKTQEEMLYCVCCEQETLSSSTGLCSCGNDEILESCPKCEERVYSVLNERCLKCDYVGELNKPKIPPLDWETGHDLMFGENDLDDQNLPDSYYEK